MSQFKLLQNYIGNTHLACEITEDGTTQVICKEDGQPLYCVSLPTSRSGISDYEKILTCVGDRMVCTEIQMGKTSMIMLGSRDTCKVLLCVDGTNH